MNRLVVPSYWIVLFIVLFPGCVYQSRGTLGYLSKNASEELRARAFDVLIPVHATLLQDKSPLSIDEARALFIVTYTISSDFEALFSLYQAEMERLGWHCVMEFIPHYDQKRDNNGHFATLIYKKPEALCCVIMDQQRQNSFVVRCMRSTLIEAT